MNTIKLENNDTLKFTIYDENDNDTGEYLEFDLEDIELPLKYQELLNKDLKNKEWIKNQMLIIDKRQDVKGNGYLTKNEEDKLKALNEFYKKQEEVYNMFLGENGVKKLACGRKLTWTIFDNIDEAIKKEILPKLDNNMKSITDKVKAKYNQAIKEEDEIEVLD